MKNPIRKKSPQQSSKGRPRKRSIDGQYISPPRDKRKKRVEYPETVVIDVLSSEDEITEVIHEYNMPPTPESSREGSTIGGSSQQVVKSKAKTTTDDTTVPEIMNEETEATNPKVKETVEYKKMDEIQALVSGMNATLIHDLQITWQAQEAGHEILLNMVKERMSLLMSKKHNDVSTLSKLLGKWIVDFSRSGPYYEDRKKFKLAKESVCEKLTRALNLKLKKPTRYREADEDYLFNISAVGTLKRIREEFHIGPFDCQSYAMRKSMRFDHIFTFIDHVDKRSKMLEKLTDYEKDLNKAARKVEGKETPLIQVENHVDLFSPKFEVEKYSKDYHLKVSFELKLFDESWKEKMQCCNCNICDSNCPCIKDCACRSTPYTDGILVNEVMKNDRKIYECGPKCGAENCGMNMVSRGRQYSITLFKTLRKGWGIRTNEFIPKGSFIEKYAGELVTVEEAARRNQRGGHNFYHFDLKHDDHDAIHSVDAEEFGNLSRFFNHCCDPNMHAYSVQVRGRNPNLPFIAFYAIRDILPGQELTFDYSPQLKEASVKSRSRRRKKAVQRRGCNAANGKICLCEADKCRGEKWVDWDDSEQEKD